MAKGSAIFQRWYPLNWATTDNLLFQGKTGKEGSQQREQPEGGQTE